MRLLANCFTNREQQLLLMWCGVVCLCFNLGLNTTFLIASMTVAWYFTGVKGHGMYLSKMFRYQAKYQSIVVNVKTIDDGILTGVQRTIIKCHWPHYSNSWWRGNTRTRAAQYIFNVLLLHWILQCITPAMSCIQNKKMQLL